LAAQTPAALAVILSDYWNVIGENTGLAVNQIAEQALVAPARCCLKDTGQASSATAVGEECQVSNLEERTVEKAFAFLPQLSLILRDRYGL